MESGGGIYPSFLMNYPAASSGVSQKTLIMNSASGGELNPSELSKALDRCLFPVMIKPQWAFDSPIKLTGFSIFFIL
jgi:hypothetical protein